MAEKTDLFKTDIELLKTQMNEELLRILNYWETNTCDETYGGFVGARDHSNRFIPGEEKGAVLNCRILWTFSAACNFTKEKRWLEMADRAYVYLVDYLVDKKYGGLYWALNEDGTVSNGRKQIYAQGFGIYGLSEYFRATGKQEALHLAIQLFNLIEKFSYDSEYGGYVEALSEDWGPLNDMRLSLKDANEPKSMNTHLHILEPYTNLFRVWKDQGLKRKIEELVRIFINHVIDAGTGHFQLFFDYDWIVRSSGVSFGHDIEGAWLLAEAAHEIGNPELIAEVQQWSLKMIEVTRVEGMHDDGSLYNGKTGGLLDTDRHWWPQAEAMVGWTYAWHMSGKKLYLECLVKTWQFIQQFMVDHENGEWYWRVDANGKPYTDVKTGFWKCPYHNTRALMEVITNL